MLCTVKNINTRTSKKIKLFNIIRFNFSLESSSTCDNDLMCYLSCQYVFQT